MANILSMIYLLSFGIACFWHPGLGTLDANPQLAYVSTHADQLLAMPAL